MSIYTIRSGGEAHPETILLQLMSVLLNAGGVKDLSDTDHFRVYENSGGADMQVEVKPGRAVVAIGENAYPVYSSDDELVTIGNNASGQPRIDTVVLHMDAEASPNTDSSNVAKLSVVAGTPGASPSAPSDGAIATAIGANDAFIRLANVYVGNGVSSITDSNITDVRTQISLQSTGDGWKSLTGATITRGTANDPEYTMVFAGLDLTSTLTPGMRIKWDQNGTTRYGIITKVEFSTNTTLTVYGGTDYDVEDTSTYTISNFYYSAYKAPIGFPLDPDKWTVTMSDTSSRLESSISASTWVNPGSLSIDIPTGIWEVEYDVLTMYRSGAYAHPVSVVTLSTANNSESNTQLTARHGVDGLDSAYGDHRLYWMANARDIINLSSEDTYYLNAMTTLDLVGDEIGFRGDQRPTTIKAVSAYL